MSAAGNIGVLICSWAAGTDSRLDLEELRANASRLPDVTLAKIVPRMCSEDRREELLGLLKQDKFDRFVVAGCSAKGKEQVYRGICKLAGLHPLCFEVANIREQCACVHEKGEAQRKAKVLVQMAVEKIRLWSAPPFEDEAPVLAKVAVVGDGLAAAAVANEVAAQGVEVDLVMRGSGFEWPSTYLFTSESARRKADEMLLSLSNNLKVRLAQKAIVIGLEGSPGQFELTIADGHGVTSLSCGAIVLAPEPRSTFSRRGGTMSMEKGSTRPPSERIIILPSGSSSGTGCACISPKAIMYALEIKEKDPEAEVTLMGREVRALGGFESRYLEAQKRGVRFMRHDQDPLVTGNGPFTIQSHDALVGVLALEADAVVVESTDFPHSSLLSDIFEIPLDAKGELMTVDARLNPGETIHRGVYACHYRQGNMLADDILLDASTIASRAVEFVARGSMEIGGSVAEVKQEKCSACLACVRICPYSSPIIDSAGKAQIRIDRCQGCGICVGLCPSKAIDLYGYSDAQVIAQERTALKGVRH